MKIRTCLVIGLISAFALLFAGCQKSAIDVIPSPNSISGHVFDKKDGAPIKNALVQVEQTGTLNPPRISVKPGEPTPVLPPNNPVKAEIKTVDDGSFIISGLPSGYYYLKVTAAGYGQSDARVVINDNSNSTKDFTLSRLSSISGHVYRAEDGKPLAGAEIQVWPSFVSPYSATTGADGSYTIDALHDGLWTVNAGAEGYVPKSYDGANGTYFYDRRLEVSTQYGTDAPNIDFVLERGGSIIGRIFETDGVTPAKGAIVTYIQTSGVTTPQLFKTDLPSPYPPRVETDSGGRYIIAERLTGKYELQAIRYTDGKASSIVEISVIIGQSTIQDFILNK